VKDTKVYIITTPKGKTLVRTKPPSVRWYEETADYTIKTGWMNWKAAREIARIYDKEGPGL
jgi:hypothetical protein